MRINIGTIHRDKQEDKIRQMEIQARHEERQETYIASKLII